VVVSGCADLGDGDAGELFDHGQIHAQERCGVDEHFAQAFGWPAHFGDFRRGCDCVASSVKGSTWASLVFIVVIVYLAGCRPEVDAEMGVSPELVGEEDLDDGVADDGFEGLKGGEAVE
jgi:hypothetical protein